MNLKNIQLLIEFIDSGNTGTPKKLATQLGISERMLFKYLDILKNEFEAPIKYNRLKQTYYFTENGSIDLRWQDEISNT